MNEWLFPIGGALIAFLVGVPLLTSVARLALATMPSTLDGASSRIDGFRFLLIVAPSLGTWAWLLSASIHQAKEDTAFTACLFDHLAGDLLRDEIFFGLLLCSILVAGVLRRWQPQSNAEKRSVASEVKDEVSTREMTRLHELCGNHRALSGAAHRIRVVQRGLAPACTRGFLRPYVELEAGLIAQLSDEELTATLLHELEHVRGLDPLRFFGAQVALTINPLSRLLEPELARYRFAREAHCDRRAVQCGADPLALARSIVLAAMPQAVPAHATALGGHSLASVRMRVQLLLRYACQSPEPLHGSSPLWPTSALAMGLFLCPHILGTGPLDALHTGIERVAILLGWG